MEGGGRILVIDDSWVVIDKLKDVLAAAGYQVRTTTGALGAAKLIRGTDLCIVDFHMPGYDGAEMTKLLRGEGHADSGCLFYLYTSDPDVATRYAEHGFDGSFLRKGDEQALLPQVEAVFRTIRMRKLAQKMRDQRRF